MEIQELIERSQQGDVAAFEELVATHQQKIFNLAYHLTGNYHDASDLTQDALIRVFKALPSYRGEAAFFSWVYTIVTNLYRDYLSKNKRQNLAYLSDNEEIKNRDIKQNTADFTSDPANTYEQKERQEYLRGLIIALPLKYREVLVYREILDYSYQEISEKFDLPMGTIKSRINRGRKILQKQITSDQKYDFRQLIAPDELD